MGYSFRYISPFIHFNLIVLFNWDIQSPSITEAKRKGSNWLSDWLFHHLLPQTIKWLKEEWNSIIVWLWVIAFAILFHSSFQFFCFYLLYLFYLHSFLCFISGSEQRERKGKKCSEKKLNELHASQQTTSFK